MKKFICIAAVAAAAFCSAVSFSGCATGEAYVDYTLSEDGTYYIVSGVSGDKQGLTDYKIPETYCEEEGGEPLPVKKIGEGAFMNCSALNSIEIPESVTVIERNAFSFCGLMEVTIPESVTSIGYGAFGACSYLTEITIPESVTTIEPLAFAYCTSLKKAVVKANITVLDGKVFYNSVAVQAGNVYTNTSLTEVYLPATLEKIHSTALYGNFLTDIYVAGGDEKWESIYFYDTVLKEGTEDEYEEKKLEKSEVLSSGVKIKAWNLE